MRIERLKHHQDKYCPNCGTIISSKATYCPSCYNELRRKVERPSREVLKKHLFKVYTTKQQQTELLIKQEV